MEKITQKRIIESNYGRDFGWYVEEPDGKRLATLTEPEWDSAGQFWYFYKITPLVEEAERSLLNTEPFWKRDDLVFRNLEFNLVAPNAFGSLRPDGRVRMRGLDLYSALPKKFALLKSAARRTREKPKL